MQTSRQILKNFRQVITSVLQAFPSPDAVNAFVHLCHKIALAYLRTKFSSNKYVENRFGINIDDLAFDVIADIFAREVVSNLKTQHSSRYIEKGKLSKTDLDAIFNATEEILVNHFCLGDGDPAMYFNPKIALEKSLQITIPVIY